MGDGFKEPNFEVKTRQIHLINFDAKKVFLIDHALTMTCFLLLPQIPEVMRLPGGVANGSVHRFNISPNLNFSVDPRVFVCVCVCVWGGG